MRDLAHDLQRNRGTAADLRRCPKIDTNLAGNLGLKEMVELAITSPYLNKSVKLTGTDGAFGGYIKFVVMKNANMVGPLWVLKHFKGPGGLAGLSEVNTDQLTVAFARGDNHGKSFKPDGVEPPKSAAKAEALLNSIVLNQISTQLSNLRQ